MEVHHITATMVKDKPSFQSSKYYDELKQLLKENILVAHNAPFDIRMLNYEGVETDRFIDTQRIAKHLTKSDHYRLQYLRYFLDLNVEGDAHDALGDIIVLEKLFFYLSDLLKDKYLENNDELMVLEKMLELTNTPSLLKILNFGKYKGKTFTEISKIDKQYLSWLFDNESSKPEEDQNKDLLFSLRKFQ